MTSQVKLWQALIAAALAALGAYFGGQRFAPPAPPAAPPPPVIPRPGVPEFDAPPVPLPPPPRMDAKQAIGRITFGNAGCSATLIGPRRHDGRYLVLTANHCIAGQPRVGSMRLRNGESFPIRWVSNDPRADCAWCVTDVMDRDLPFALLADSLPGIGTRCWHAGFGVDVPGNREDGEVTTGVLADGKVGMMLSVSSGDSGGGILTDGTDRVFSCVCCTAGMARKARMYGAAVDAIKRTMPVGEVLDEWSPLPIPTVPDFAATDGGDRRIAP